MDELDQTLRSLATKPDAFWKSLLGDLGDDSWKSLERVGRIPPATIVGATKHRNIEAMIEAIRKFPVGGLSRPHTSANLPNAKQDALS